MAGVAELRLRDLEKTLFIPKTMHAMATGAAHACLPMGGTFEIGMSTLVTTETRIVDLLWRCLTELKDLCYIAAGLNVSLARPMAAFAGRCCASMHQGDAGMRVLAEVF